MSFNPQRWNAAIDETGAWLQDRLRFARANGSVLHQLLDAWHNDELIYGPMQDNWNPSVHFKALLDFKFHTFVVEHDWAGAFANSDLHLNLEELRQPYNHCSFEFEISGKRVCLISHFDGERYQFSGFVRLRIGWLPVALNKAPFCSLRDRLFAQHQAMMVALDAAVARTEVVRASSALNRSREKHGKWPAFDYHVIALAHRSTPNILPDDHDSDRRSPRLHFRRGHWRHFETFKTWINWMLVGDPDLGFIEKHYRL
jgi:hypothetical protein